VYLGWCDFMMDPTKKQRVCANLGKSLMETLAMIRQAVEEESMSCTEGPNSPRPKRVTQVKNKIKSLLNVFFDIKGIVHKKNRLGTPNSQFRILL
jgi:hypothetical protein